MARKPKDSKSPLVQSGDAPAGNDGGLAAADVKKIQQLLKSKTTEGVAMGLSLLESLNAAPSEYESVLTETVMTSILNGWYADSWGALARVAKLTESLSRLLVEEVGKKTDDLSRMIRQRRQADQAIALVRAVALPSLYETLLAGCEAVCDGPRRGVIRRNRLFDECEEHRTRALLQLAAYAPDSGRDCPSIADKSARFA